MREQVYHDKHIVSANIVNEISTFAVILTEGLGEEKKSEYIGELIDLYIGLMDTMSDLCLGPC